MKGKLEPSERQKLIEEGVVGIIYLAVIIPLLYNCIIIWVVALFFFQERI